MQDLETASLCHFLTYMTLGRKVDRYLSKNESQKKMDEDKLIFYNKFVPIILFQNLVFTLSIDFHSEIPAQLI